MDKRKVIVGLMVVLVLTSLVSAKNYGVVDYMLDKDISFIDIVGKTIGDLLKEARFFTLIHEDGSVERVGLIEESVREGFDIVEKSKRDKIKKGPGFVGGNYSFGFSSMFDEDMVGTAKVLVNSTFVEIKFNNEYVTVPIVTLTPVGLPDFFYGVDDVNTTGFKILISKKHKENVVFNWHAFAQELEVTNETIIEDEIVDVVNVTVPEEIEKEIVIPEVVNEENKTTINETEEVNETILEVNNTIPEINNTEEIIINETEKSKEKKEKKNENSSEESEVIEEEVEEGIIEAPQAYPEKSQEEIFTEGKEPEEEVGAPITGGVIGTNNQDGILTRLVKFIGGLFK